jgi:hypothetical protein
MTLRGRSVLAHLFELWIGLAGMISALAFFYAPASIDGNALARTFGYAPAAVWTVGYGVAGSLIWYGLLRPSIRMETVGLWVLGGSTSIEGVAIVAVFGGRGAATFVLYFSLTVAAWMRALVVFRGAMAVAREHVADGR